MGMIKRALRRTSRKLLNKIIPHPSHSHQLVLNGANELALHEHEQMGAKRKLASSLQRKLRKSGSKDTAVAQALLLAVKNHLPPIQFHHIHGLHAQLSANKCVARRTQSFCQALVFSNRVILPNERVYIKVLEIAKCWSGTIRFGFTAVDPATLACRMPKHACPDMTNAGHTWARALADEVVRRNSVIHFSYNKNGIIHYGINNQDCGIFHANVGTNQNLWFIVDIYGLTAAVELIDPRTNNAASNNESDFSQDGGSARARSLATTPATMYKSTSAMDELFGQSRYGSNSAGRRKKLSRKHARHAALIQANWPIADGYHHQHHYPGVNFINSHYGQLQPQGAMQLPNLNSVTLPSAQQNIYSPMPSLPPPVADQQQRRPQTRAGRDESHDYHQIMSNTYSSNQSAAHQPGRTGASMAPKLTGSVSMANIAHLQTSGATLAATASSSSRHDVSAAGAAATASPISQADLSHQFETMHLYERRMRKHQQQLAAAAAAAAISNQTPVAATRKRQHLQPISLNQTNLKRTPETDRDQLDKSASATSKAAHRIVSAKSAPSSSAGKTAAGTQTASLKPKTRHSIKTHKAATKPGDNSPDDSPPSKDCPICFERPINCVLYQCGHMCTCYECGVKQWKTQSRTCPICRTVIKDVIKTYMS